MLLLQIACAAAAAFCATPATPATPAAARASNNAVAVRIERAPRLDAGLDGTWRAIPATTAFRQWLPREDTEPSFRTEFRVAYDAENLYVLVRAFDPHPDSVVRTMARRDQSTLSDEVAIYIDPANDHRTGYEFYVNAGGVLRDAALSGDSREDYTWDGVWDAVARVDSVGWIAEFRIPFAQLRFPTGTKHFGFLVNRYISRRNEEASWPLYRRSRTGIVS
jgi:hypothetical protein